MVERSSRLPNLDGLRALAILSVLFAHSRAFFTPESFLYSFSGPFNQGVDLFFAISGLLITTLLYREYQASGSINFKSFYIRRAFRILPPLLFYLAIISVLGAEGLLKISRLEIISSLLFFRNYLMYLPNATLTNHFWSLSVEEHFYLFWPLCLFLLKPRKAIAFGVALALVVAVWRGIDAHMHLFARFLPDAGVKFRTDTRLDALLWGAVAALMLPRLRTVIQSRKLSALPPIALISIIVINAARVPLAPTLLAIGFAILVISCIIYDQTAWTRWLETPQLAWIGTLSYSIYIWQTLWLQTDFLSGRWPSALPHVLILPADLICTLSCASVSFYFVEQPLRRIGYKIAGGRVVAPSSAEVLPMNAA